MVKSEADAGLGQTIAIHASASRDGRRKARMLAKAVVIQSLFAELFLITLRFFLFLLTLSGTAQRQSDNLGEMGQHGATAPRVLH